MSSNKIIGRQFANFRVLRHLGHGGMADVYLGHDVQLDRPVAIKVLDPRHQGDRAYAKRFVREAQAIASWRHENIIQVHYAGEEDGITYFVMDYIDGRDLGDILGRKRKLMRHDEVIDIGRAVANALDYAHSQGVVHRDVKPANVMIAKDGQVVLTDFGLALDMTEGSVGEVFGSANYVSPEQARNSAEAVPQSDLYSLGVMMYEMLVGSLPFDDPSFTTVAIQHITEPPPPPREVNPHLNEETEKVLLKALHKTPSRRYKSANQLIDALQEALQAPAPASSTAKQRSKRISVSRSTSARRLSNLEPALAKRAAKSSSRAKRASVSKSSRVKEPTAPPANTPVEDPRDVYKRVGLYIWGVVVVVMIIVLSLWLLTNAV